MTPLVTPLVTDLSAAAPVDAAPVPEPVPQPAPPVSWVPPAAVPTNGSATHGAPPVSDAPAAAPAPTAAPAPAIAAEPAKRRGFLHGFPLSAALEVLAVLLVLAFILLRLS